MNELNLFCFIANLFIIALCGILMAIIPTLTRKTFLFGVRIPESAQNHVEIKKMKNQYITIIANGAGVLFILAIVQYIFMPDLSLLACLYAPFVLVALQAAVFISNWKKALRLKEANNWQTSISSFAETSSSHTRGNLSVVPWGYYILSVILIFISIVVAFIEYPSIPDPMPIHFDVNMNPDGWAAKSVGTVLMMPLINLGTTITMLLIAVAIIKAKLQINTQNPALSFAQHRAYRRLMGHGVGIMAIGMVIAFMLLGFMTIFPEQFAGKISSGLMLGMITLPTVPLVVISIRAGQGGCKLKPKITETDNLATGYRSPDAKTPSPAYDRGDDKYWKIGMFYYNPNDPAVLVEDRFGNNIGFNYARIGAKIFIAAVALGTIALYVWITVVFIP